MHILAAQCSQDISWPGAVVIVGIAAAIAAIFWGSWR